MGRGDSSGRVGAPAAEAGDGGGVGVDSERYRITTAAPNRARRAVIRDLRDAGEKSLSEMRVSGDRNRSIRSVVVVAGSDSACRRPSRLERNSSAVVKRSSGVLAMAFSVTRSSEAGIEGATVRRGLGVVDRTW